MHPGLLNRPLGDYISFVEDRLGHDRRYAIDASKIQENLVGSQRMILRDGMSKTISWYHEDLALAG